MKPNEIRAELVRRGKHVRHIAASQNVAKPTVSQTISSGKGPMRIKEEIARAIEQPVFVVFPLSKVTMSGKSFELLAACTRRLVSEINPLSPSASLRIEEAIAKQDIDALVGEHVALLSEILTGLGSSKSPS